MLHKIDEYLKYSHEATRIKEFHITKENILKSRQKRTNALLVVNSKTKKQNLKLNSTSRIKGDDPLQYHDKTILSHNHLLGITARKREERIHAT